MRVMILTSKACSASMVGVGTKVFYDTLFKEAVFDDRGLVFRTPKAALPRASSIITPARVIGEQCHGLFPRFQLASSTPNSSSPSRTRLIARKSMGDARAQAFLMRRSGSSRGMLPAEFDASCDGYFWQRILAMEFLAEREGFEPPSPNG